MGLELPCPFRDISIKTKKTLKRSLDPVVIKTLSAIELEKDSPLSLARDIFMFSFYTRGMSFVDIALLKKRHVFPGEICYRRHKTDQLMRVGINKEISRILERYKNVPGEYISRCFRQNGIRTLVIETPTIGFVTLWERFPGSLVWNSR